MAGNKIMQIHARGVTANSKSDGSPVTEADEAAEKILLARLAEAAPDITVISEENANSHTIAASDRFFLVDPLDGTKEFLKADGKGAFTVNVALIENGVPVFGIVYAPALDRMFIGSAENGAFEGEKKIETRISPQHGAVAVASAAHPHAAAD